MSTRLRQRGVTIVELILFILIVTIAVGGILGVLRLTTGQSADPLRRKQALMIAESLMEEVQQAYFTYCDPTDANFDAATSSAGCATLPENWAQESGNTARPYDNVNDYVGAAATPTAAFSSGGTILDASNNSFGVSGYSATVSIRPAALNGIGADGGPGSSADTPVLLITVTVAYGGDSVVLDAYRTRYAPN